jgi:hypothetical protein
MYVTLSVVGRISFRFDYRLNARRETLTLGRCDLDGISPAVVRERCVDARRASSEGRSPAQEKQREKRRLAEAQTFKQFSDQWAAGARLAASTRSMRMSVLSREILPAFKNRMLTETTADDLRALCNKVKARGAPATAVHVRDIVKQINGFAILHGVKVANPADDVEPSSIATFVPKDRACRPRKSG